MYELLDSRKKNVLQAQTKARRESREPRHIFESVRPSRLEAFPLGDELSWIYKNDIEKTWQDYLERERLEDGVLLSPNLWCYGQRNASKINQVVSTYDKKKSIEVKNENTPKSYTYHPPFGDGSYPN